MYNDKLYVQFCLERNLKKNTKKCYESSLKSYTEFHEMTISELFEEALEDEKNIHLIKNRNIKRRMIDYRNYLLEQKNMTTSTIKTYISKIRTFYSHFEIEIPDLPPVKYERAYEINYLDLPTKEHIRKAIEISSLPIKALILFMSSSGTARAETLSLKVEDFINGTYEYYTKNNLYEILEELEKRNDIIPTLYLKRIKTDKYYYTFCSPEASNYIVKYLKTRKNLKLTDKLFDFSNASVLTNFQKINDQMKWGFKGKYRFFRSHTLRKFHASNLGIAAEYIDALQGRSKNKIHETYIKTNPDKLKQIYKEALPNILIYKDQKNPTEIHEDIHITINVFVSENSYTL
ncbi:integrase [Methanosphaera cuniculi]|uniref:tyrosine-type recombinase/integrase n=1 Tax=Methanosphaera cuniculi TaxID=1077256 RepID=UPI0026F0E56B|nr:integrase [Methanosphaera cuniculi]